MVKVFSVLFGISEEFHKASCKLQYYSGLDAVHLSNGIFTWKEVQYDIVQRCNHTGGRACNTQN